MKRIFWRSLAVFVCLAAALTAATVTIPQSALIPSTTLYTDQIGGGIGSTLVMTGGGSSANVGALDGRNDDGFSLNNLGFTLNYFGNPYTQFYANNNGNVSFGSGISAYVPQGPTGAAAPVISAWFGDVDTRNTASGVMSLRNDIANEIIVTWPGVGRYDARGDLLNTFQIVLRGPDYVVPQGEGQIGFFWTTMQWESTDTSQTAAVGFGDGAGNGQVLEGSTTAGLNGVVQNHHIWFNINDQGVPITPVGEVPEPGTLGLMAAGLVGLAAFARRKRAA